MVAANQASHLTAAESRLPQCFHRLEGEFTRARHALRFDHASKASAGCRSAFRPLKFSNLCTITSQYSGSNSIRNALPPRLLGPDQVLPLPSNKSRTFSPGRDEY